MADDDDKVIPLPSLDDLLNNPRRFFTPQQRGEADAAARPGRGADARAEAGQAAGPEAVGPADAGVPSLDTLKPLPKPGDPYSAYGRPANQAVATLHVILSDGRKCGFPYSTLIEGPHLLPGDPGQGDSVVLRYSGSVTYDVTLHGRHLEELHNYLGDHRIRWLRERPKGRFALPDGDIPLPIIARVVIAQAEGWPPPGME